VPSLEYSHEVSLGSVLIKKEKNMLEQTLRFRPALVLILGLSLLCLGSLAQAYDNHGNRYRYHDGQWYGQGDVVVTDVPVGSVIETLPPQYTTVVVGSNSYYYDNTRYYSRSPDGTYIVVERPVVVEAPAAPLIQIKL
jgi:hypothetical protein